MAYVALYRKWRPDIFEDVIGQGHIVQTLKNQIKNDNIAHAYLFCGTRGTGKTSTAKIFARAVNCLQPVAFNPCNECEICQGIRHETMMDVIEIDAASNNGVDDIRELRENVKYPPTKGRYKVYIIDEVHMLSTGAFNALLKTLEEPPKHVIFILATTEPHKIPATILSRCQRFDFKRVKEGDMVQRLAYICKEMDIDAEEAALKSIVRNADGAMRDALSILDQCVAFGQERITYDDVVEVLGTVTDEFMFRLVDCVSQKDARGAMELIESLIEAGKDTNQFIKDMLGHYRNLMMTKAARQLEGIVNLSKENIERLQEQGAKLQINQIIRAIQVFSQTEAEAKWSTQPRILLEVAVIKLCQPSLDHSLEGMAERIQQLEKLIQSGCIVSEKKVEKATERKPETRETPSTRMTVKEKAITAEEKVETAVDFQKIRGSWEDILKEIKKRKISIHAVLMEGVPSHIENSNLIIAFKDGYGFHKEATGSNPYKEFIEGIILEVTKQKVHIKCMMEEEIQARPDSTGEICVSEEDDDVRKIIEIFGEDLVEIVDE
ncbi:MAG: DNA polymerase III subunit gamma/tau [Bacillota bacterium]